MLKEKAQFGMTDHQMKMHRKKIFKFCAAEVKILETEVHQIQIFCARVAKRAAPPTADFIRVSLLLDNYYKMVKSNKTKLAAILKGWL